MFSRVLIALTLTSLALASPLEYEKRDDPTSAVIRYFYVPKDYTLACGSSSYDNSSYILEAPEPLFNGGAACGQKIKITNPEGTSAVGTIQDACGQGCGLNLSPGLFQLLAPLSQGRFDGTYEVTDDPVGPDPSSIVQPNSN